MFNISPQLQIEFPIIQAPMAGVSTSALAAAVSRAGGLGSIATGTSSVAQVRQMMADVRQLTHRPFNVNLFCHRPVPADPLHESRWLSYLRPFFAEFGTEPPTALIEPFTSFLNNDALLHLLLKEPPAVVSFHFGLPHPAQLAALRQTGAALLACVTSPAEAHLAEDAGVDALIAQGIEAGGHRGCFEPDTSEGLGTLALTRLLVQQRSVPVIAAGGIMNGADIAAVLGIGAVAAQMGTAFVACPESAADGRYRAALLRQPAWPTAMTSVISGRPARGLINRFMQDVDQPGRPEVIPYPWAYSATKALMAAAQKSDQVTGFDTHWAGEGLGRSRALPAVELVRVLMKELNAFSTPYKST